MELEVSAWASGAVQNAYSHSFRACFFSAEITGGEPSSYYGYEMYNMDCASSPTAYEYIFTCGPHANCLLGGSINYATVNVSGKTILVYCTFC